MAHSEKQAIRAAFDRAAHTYDAVAQIQRRIATALLTHKPDAQSILDAGCGTGFGARHLAALHPHAHVIGLDLALAMCSQSSAVQNLCGDIEALPLASNSLDLYWSSLAWQWTHAERAIAEAARTLASGGLLRVATLGPDTLQELRHSFAAVDPHPHVRSFLEPAIYAELLERHGFTHISVTRTLEHTFSADLLTLLKDIRTLGAHTLGAPRRKGMLGRQAWQTLLAKYEAYRQAAGLPVSYDVIYLSATQS